MLLRGNLTDEAARIVATVWRQLCSSLLHNWSRASEREAGWQ